MMDLYFPGRCSGLFKEVYCFAADCLDVKNRIELRHIIEKVKINREETCFLGLSHMTQKQYIEAVQRAKKISNHWL